MEQIGESLGRLVRKLDRPEATLAWLESAWPRIVGLSLAAHTRPLRYQAGQLYIAADAHPWAREIHDMEDQVRVRINKAWGKELVRQIKTAALSEQEVSKDSDNRHTPFLRRSSGRSSS